MTPVLAARLVLMAIGIVVWGYGYRVDAPQTRMAGMIVLAIALALRLLPKHWTGDTPRDRHEEP